MVCPDVYKYFGIEGDSIKEIRECHERQGHEAAIYMDTLLHFACQCIELSLQYVSEEEAFEYAEWVSFLYRGLKKTSVPGEEKEIPGEVLNALDEYLLYN